VAAGKVQARQCPDQPRNRQVSVLPMPWWGPCSSYLQGPHWLLAQHAAVAWRGASSAR